MTGWALVGGDPAPGQPDLIKSSVTQLRVSEDAVRQVGDALDRIARGTTEADWEGECATAMREVLEGFRHDLGPIAESFLRVRHALSGYVSELVDLQAAARQALRRAEVADARRQTGETQKRDGIDLLNRQRAQLAASQAAQVRQGAAAAIQNATDPSAAPANAQEAQRLARNTQAIQRSINDTQATIRRIDHEINAAVAEFQQARHRIDHVHDAWDQLGNRTADRVEDALADVLRNRSNLEKLRDRVFRDLQALIEFVDDPLHHLSLLRDVIDKVHGFLSELAGILAFAAIITGALGLPISPILAAAAFVVGALALAYSLTKLILDVVLYNTDYREDGKLIVSRGDLVGDVVDVGADVVSVVLSRGAVKIFTAPTLSTRTIAAGELKLAIKKAAIRGTEHIGKGVRDDLIKDGVERTLRDVVMPPTVPHPRCTVVIPPRALAAVEAPTAALASGGGR